MTVQPVSQSRIQSAIALASSRTGVDFGYLLGQAKLESGLNANARAAFRPRENRGEIGVRRASRRKIYADHTLS